MFKRTNWKHMHSTHPGTESRNDRAFLPGLDINKEETQIKLYEVEWKNRVIDKLKGRPIRGQQGRWYYEIAIVIASNRKEIAALIDNKLKSRKILGKPRRDTRRFRREIEITKVRRLV